MKTKKRNVILFLAIALIGIAMYGLTTLPQTLFAWLVLFGLAVPISAYIVLHWLEEKRLDIFSVISCFTFIYFMLEEQFAGVYIASAALVVVTTVLCWIWIEYLPIDDTTLLSTYYLLAIKDQGQLQFKAGVKPAKLRVKKYEGKEVDVWLIGPFRVLEGMNVEIWEDPQNGGSIFVYGKTNPVLKISYKPDFGNKYTSGGTFGFFKGVEGPDDLQKPTFLVYAGFTVQEPSSEETSGVVIFPHQDEDWAS